MKQLELIQSFAKGKATDNANQSQRNAVIYTRVSTTEQADTSQILETQKKYCLQYALKHDHNVLGFFGGTYESAKTDERNGFNRMIRFVKNQKDLPGLVDRSGRISNCFVKELTHFKQLYNTVVK